MPRLINFLLLATLVYCIAMATFPDETTHFLHQLVTP
jgi:hypothetical protein